MREPFKLMRGFTLIEILVALTIVSVGVLAIGSFSISTLGSGQISRERLTAVHLAEQFLEEWQKTDTLPILNINYCNPAVAWTVLIAPTVLPCPISGTTTTSTASCIPLFGSKLSYNISAIESQVCGPSTTGVAPFVAFTGTTAPKTKMVKVSWTHRGDHNVFLTHVSTP